MKAKSLSLVAGVLFLLSTSAVAQDKLEVHAQLKLADNKTTFKIGEPIRVVLELTAERDGYLADSTYDQSESSTDQLTVTPEAGVSHWRRESFGGGYPRDYFTIEKLSATPIKIQFELNDSIRFERPGRYTVRYTTRRARPSSSAHDYLPPIPLTTNEVSFDVQAMSDAEEEQEVKRIAGLIDGAHDWQTQSKFARELAFLTGDSATREKVRRFFSAQGTVPGNYFGEIHSGLYIARNRALVLQLLEKAMRDPSTQVESSLLSTLTSLRFLEENLGLGKPVTISTFGPNADPRVVAIEESYIRELAAGLGKRAGKAQTVTAMTVLTHLPKDPKAAEPLLAESKQILLEQFESLSVFGHEYLLEQYWNVLRDPSLIPVLKKLLASTDSMSKGIHKTVLKRLIDLSPDEARPYVIAEINDPMSMVDPEILGSLPDKTLPEVDQPLLSQLRTMAKGDMRMELEFKQKTALAVRYATSSIYPDLMATYTENLKHLTISSRAALLAYLAKQNEREALPLIEQQLEELPVNQEFSFLPELTSLYYSDGIAAILRKRVESDQPEVASTTAYLLAKYGDAGDRKILEARLERWRKEWGARQLEADTNQQGRIEVELVLGLNRAKDGPIAPERVKELQQSCISKMCKQQFPTPQP
jgi:hypothetical protein